MNKRWPHRKTKHKLPGPGGKKRKKPRARTILFYREEVSNVNNDSKNVLVSKTAWVFAILLFVGVLKATGLVDFELADSEAEGIALGIVAIVGIVLRLVSSQRVTILPR